MSVQNIAFGKKMPLFLAVNEIISALVLAEDEPLRKAVVEKSGPISLWTPHESVSQLFQFTVFPPLYSKP